MGPRIDRFDKSEGTVITTADDQMKGTSNTQKPNEDVLLHETLQKVYKDDFGDGLLEKLMKRIATEITPDEQIKRVNRVLNNNNTANRTHWRETLNAWMDAISNSTLNRAIDDVPQLSFLIGDRIKMTGDSTVLTRLTSSKKIDVLEMALDDPKVNAKAAQGLTMAFSAMTAKEKNKVIDDMQRRSPDELPNFLKISAHYVDNILLAGINKENAVFIRKTYVYLEAHAATLQDRDLYAKISHFMEGWIEETYKRRSDERGRLRPH